MYSTLDKLDLLVTDPDGRPAAVLTDHRTRDEIEAEPEISVLFAISRVVLAKQHLAAQRQGETVVYLTPEEPPAFLLEALAATGALFQTKADRPRQTPGPATASVEELADRAFSAIAERVARRVGLTDRAAVLRALEAETVANAPRVDLDEPGYWARVFELMAVTVAVMRVNHQGTWTTTNQSDVPFAFSMFANQQMMPANRAQRFLADGADESMFLFVASAEEVTARGRGELRPGPLMPNLRPRDEAVASNMIWKQVLERVESDALPVIIYGHDGETMIGWLTRATNPDAEQAHAEALANLARLEVEIEELELQGARVLVVSNSFFATEKVLDVAFMRQLQRRLDSELLAVGVPRRGVMFVGPAEHVPAIFPLVAEAYEHGGTRRICPLLLLVQDGDIVGFARPDEAPPAAPKKRGLFSRLFGRR